MMCYDSVEYYVAKALKCHFGEKNLTGAWFFINSRNIFEVQSIYCLVLNTKLANADR